MLLDTLPSVDKMEAFLADSGNSIHGTCGSLPTKSTGSAL
jgi:hypothetical protein